METRNIMTTTILTPDEAYEAEKQGDHDAGLLCDDLTCEECNDPDTAEPVVVALRFVVRDGGSYRRPFGVWDTHSSYCQPNSEHSTEAHAQKRADAMNRKQRANPGFRA